MTDKNITNIEMNLLKEAIWTIEDKLDIVLECIAEHELELIKLKQISKQCLKPKEGGKKEQ